MEHSSVLVRNSVPRTAVAVFVKTPGLSSIKTRLARGIGEESAREFYRRSVQITEELLLQWSENHSYLQCYWAVAEKGGVNHLGWKSFPCLYQGEGDLGARLSCIFDQLWLKDKYEQVVFLGGDSPLITKDHLLEGVTKEFKSNQASFYVGPSCDGGFYMLVARNYIPPYVWQNISYSTNFTAEQLITELRKIGEVKIGRTLYDVDELEDFFRLSQEEASSPCWNLKQRELIRWTLNIKNNF